VAQICSLFIVFAALRAETALMLNSTDDQIGDVTISWGRMLAAGAWVFRRHAGPRGGWSWFLIDVVYVSNPLCQLRSQSFNDLLKGCSGIYV